MKTIVSALIFKLFFFPPPKGVVVMSGGGGGEKFPNLKTFFMGKLKLRKKVIAYAKLSLFPPPRAVGGGKEFANPETVFDGECNSTIKSDVSI